MNILSLIERQWHEPPSYIVERFSGTVPLHIDLCAVHTKHFNFSKVRAENMYKELRICTLPTTSGAFEFEF